MIYITGDTHGQFGHVKRYCLEHKTTAEDVLVILGDAGINYGGEAYDIPTKKGLGKLPITLFCIHGNHEMRPETIETYKTKEWRGGIVYYEEQFPNILFGKDGEIYNFDGKKTIVIGGAYSIDKDIRLLRGWKWFADEQPSKETKQHVEERLRANDWVVDVVLSHTAPLKYEPVELFMPGVNQDLVDKSTEKWLDRIEDKLDYEKWYFGHYHGEKKIDKMQMMFENIEVFCKELQ